MKEFLRKILPESLLYFLRSIKRQISSLKKYLVIQAKIKLSLPTKKKLDKIRFEIHLAEHCNLNCAGCNHFSPIAKPELIDPEEFTRDIARMGELFGHDCERIFLMGGEPLLHPDIVRLMKTAREIFPASRIIVYTNGILLLTKDSDFWNACHDNNIGIQISRYPIKLDLQAIENTAEKFGVELQYVSVPKDTFVITPIDLSGSGNTAKSFAFCYESNNCITLKHGKLFTCVFAAHVHHFTEKFGVEIPITEADYIDIYKETDGDTILEKIARPIPACRFCSGGRFTKSSRKINWHHTEQKISEWI